VSQGRIARARPIKPKAKPEPFPWLPLLILIATIALFWFLPTERHPAPVRVEFVRRR
jgi:hypothetical protein